MLEKRFDTTADDLSGGQQQILALAMTMVHEPELLIIDELSLGLAPVVVQQVLEAVQHLHDAGITMIIVEQSLNVALAIADRALFMEKGEIRFEGSTVELAAPTTSPVPSSWAADVLTALLAIGFSKQVVPHQAPSPD